MATIYYKDFINKDCNDTFVVSSKNEEYIIYHRYFKGLSVRQDRYTYPLEDGFGSAVINAFNRINDSNKAKHLPAIHTVVVKDADGFNSIHLEDLIAYGKKSNIEVLKT